MATEEEIYRIVVQTQGEEEVKRLSAEVTKQENALRTLVKANQGMTAAQMAASNSYKTAASELIRLNTELKKAEQATKAAGAATGRTGQLMIQAGYAVDDLQFGFKGIANNIQPLLMNIPKLAGLAPVISIAAIAAYQLYEHWDQLNDALGFGSTKTEADRMKELGEKTTKTAEETMKLLKYEKERASLSTQNKDTKKHEETTSEISEALREVTPKRVNEAVDQIYGDRIRNSVSNDTTQAARRAKGKLNAAQGEVDNLNRQDPGQVSAHQMAQAVKTRDRYQKEFNTALEAFNKEYNEKRDTVKARLATELNSKGEAEKLEKFIAESEKRGLLTAKEAESLRNANPEKKDELAQDAFAREREMQHASQKAAFEEQQRHQAIAENSAGLRSKLSPEILNNIARGKDNDPVALAAKISAMLQKGGTEKGKANELAPEIADDLLHAVGLQVRERANEQGLSKQEAAAREAEDSVQSAKSRAQLAKGSISDAGGFARSLQQAAFGGGDPIQKGILDAARESLRVQKDMLEGTRKVLPREKFNAVAAGPA